MAIFKVVKGKKVEMSASEVKSKIMQMKGWSELEYKRQYNLLRNRTRNYEKFSRESGGKEEHQNIQHMIYFEAKREKQKDYTPSIKMQMIKSFSAQSTSKSFSPRTRAKMENAYENAVNRRFAGLISKNEKAREIAEKITNPVARDRALADFANTLHLKMKKSGEAESKSAIPYGQKIGSTESFDFDYSAYLGY